jgi:hypothetical protein
MCDFSKIKNYIQENFSSIYEVFKSNDNNCRGASTLLYKKINDKISDNIITGNIEVINLIEELKIITGISHTYIRGKLKSSSCYFIIDPTIAQFSKIGKVFKEGIYVGSLTELLNFINLYDSTELNNYTHLVGSPPPTEDVYLMKEALLNHGGKSRKSRKTKFKKYKKIKSRRKNFK